ncbi:universal stress protein [Aquiflexum sp. TKW24L]|uniref:universal stress protein n=1 Tax=Aquiflexum sp. TKW24L TaxID=2942212 RepID=UPI0020BF273C|nr:universal stress protein [Aquiflexum sp. TKW24L]MCL6259614.1 universal stress protein [Aquiflexum sp. TKW24L]
MKRIIVPIDFSSYSDFAFLSALKIAQKADSSITCVNVVSTLLDWNHLSNEQKAKNSDVQDMEAEAKDKLKSFILEHKLHAVPVEPVVGIGVPQQVILDLSKKHKADLIVIGAYGAGHIDGKFVGSTLQHVLRNADCPVMAVKKPLSGNDLRKMVFASMFNEDSRPAFTKMKAVLKDFQTSVHFLFVNTPTHFVNSDIAESRMDAYAKGFEDLVIHKHVYCHAEPENGIVEFAKKRKIGFIGIASGNRKGMATYQVGVTDTVLYKSEIAVLSVKIE